MKSIVSLTYEQSPSSPRLSLNTCMQVSTLMWLQCLSVCPYNALNKNIHFEESDTNIYVVCIYVLICTVTCNNECVCVCTSSKAKGFFILP